MSAPGRTACAYCGRDMWLAGLRRCCDRPDHEGTLVCEDSQGCLAVILDKLHEQAVREAEWLWAQRRQVSSGPFETERDAEVASLWEAQGRACGLDPGSANRAELFAALSGVKLGAHDRRILEWLANHEPSTVAVISGLIGRARAKGGAR